ncbi:MAG: LysM peptidoglycan-binding domain-containing protein, partial [Oscillospiraceae bacterium]
PSICADLDLPAEKILADNPQLTVSGQELTFPALYYTVQPGDTLGSIQNKFKLSDADMLKSCYNHSRLIRKGAQAGIYGMQAGSFGKTNRMIAAVCFAHYCGNLITDGYQQYVQQILDLNPNSEITLDWVGGYSSHQVRVPFGGANFKWRSFFGDTVLILAKASAILNQTVSELPQEWNQYWEFFKRETYIQESQADDIPINLRVPTITVPVENDCSWKELLLKYDVGNNNSSDYIIRYPYFTQDILTPLTQLTLYNAKVTLPNGATVGEILRGQSDALASVSLSQLAEALQKQPQCFSSGQTITVQGPDVLTSAALLEFFQTDAFCERAFAMASRFMLQGLRVPDPRMDGNTVPLFKLMYQQLPVTPNQDFIVFLEAPARPVMGKSRPLPPWHNSAAIEFNRYPLRQTLP